MWPTRPSSWLPTQPGQSPGLTSTSTPASSCTSLLSGWSIALLWLPYGRPVWRRIMARRGRPTVPIELSEVERETLERWVRRHASSQALALRSRIVLGCAEGLTNKEVAAAEGVLPATVSKWRHRFSVDRLE